MRKVAHFNPKVACLAQRSQKRLLCDDGSTKMMCARYRHAIEGKSESLTAKVACGRFRHALDHAKGCTIYPKCGVWKVSSRTWSCQRLHVLASCGLFWEGFWSSSDADFRRGFRVVTCFAACLGSNRWLVLTRVLGRILRRNLDDETCFAACLGSNRWLVLTGVFEFIRRRF